MRKILAILLLLLCMTTASMAAPKWESVNVTGHTATLIERSAESNDNVEVSVGDGYIYVSCQRPTTVKVFTILGQLISQETLPAGTHRLRMSSKGIYILKAADVTRRVTI